MSDEKVYTPTVINDNPFPQEEISSSSISQEASGGIYAPQTTKEKTFPKKRIAVDTIGAALNTKSRKILAEFEFTESGSISIGKYSPGVSGDVRITPNGITARDSAGLITFDLDGTTGDAVFKGILQAGTIIGAGNKVLIDELDDNGRILIYGDDGNPQILIGYQENGF